MFSVQTNKLVSLAQKGDPYARGILLVRNRSFVKKTASRFCNRVLQWNIDQEMEIALDAFDEAIDSFRYGGELLISRRKDLTVPDTSKLRSRFTAHR